MPEATPPGRVLHVFGAMNRGGAETLIMGIYRGLERTALQFDFAVSTSAPANYDEEIRKLGGRIFPHPAPAAAGLPAYRRALRDTLDRFGPFTAVHSHIHHFSGVVLEAAARTGVGRRLAHSHTTTDGRRDSVLRRAYRSAMRRLLRKHATHLLGCSPEACEALYGRNCWRDGRVQLVPNAIELSRFRRLSSDSRELRRRLSLPEGGLLVGHVGSFTRPKNHAFLLSAFAALSSRLPDAHLVLTGDGPLRRGVEQLADTHQIADRVHFLGIRTDIPEVLGALDVLLLPSLWEGFPIALVEAQAAGLPCVVSDAVTPTADLGLGLVRFVGLQEGARGWAHQVLEALQLRRPGREHCCRVLKSAGYDAADLCGRLNRMYA